MQKLRITKEQIKQDFSGGFKEVYFLDLVENNSSKNLTSGTLEQIKSVLPKYRELYPKAFIISDCVGLY